MRVYVRTRMRTHATPSTPRPAHHAQVAELVARLGGGRGPPRFPPLLLDVCCGGGAIGLWVAQAAAAAGTSTRVLGIEVNQAAAADAAANAAANGLDAAQYSVARGRAEDHIATLEQRPHISSTKRAAAHRSTCAARVEQKACGLLCSGRRAAVSPRQRPGRGCWRPLARWQEAGALPPPYSPLFPPPIAPTLSRPIAISADL